MSPARSPAPPVERVCDFVRKSLSFLAGERIYADASVFAGCDDEALREPSQRILNAFARGVLVLVISDLTLDELHESPPPLRQRLDAIPSRHVDLVRFDEEARGLADDYLKEGLFWESTWRHAEHVALATVARVEVLASWRIQSEAGGRVPPHDLINLRRGYGRVEVRTPGQVWFYD